ncbi:unnamed protein product [Staurois parvus]|uniref:Uncharacterized protein n=1 Tax=Staurois parvus TaxID=386267 RepID=A0ABN9GS32_9NEOB|nr:unnamed protein product [Staurois parvus]
MQGPGRADIVNAGNPRETRYSECRVQGPGRPDIVNAGSGYSECWVSRPDIVNAGSQGVQTR